MKKKKSYKIRFATQRDLDALVKLEIEAFETDRFTKDQIEYLLTQSSSTTFVLEYKDKIAGAACLLWRKAVNGARLYNLAVDPVYHGKGLGIALLNECEKEAAYRSCHKISLEVREDNHGAIGFYEKYGYKTDRIIKDYYSDGASGIKMSKAIDKKVPMSVRYAVPYYSQTLDFTCGPACLMMALKFFDKNTELTRSLELSLWKEATLIFMASGYAGTDGYGLALSALNRGLSSYIVMSMDKTPMLKSVRNNYKRDVMKIVHHDMRKKAKKAGLGSATFQYGIDEIISALQRDMLPIVMISTYRLTGDRVPHWVIVTGFDKKYIYIHDPDVASYRKNRSRARNLRIEHSEFLRMSRYGKEVYRCLLLVGEK